MTKFLTIFYSKYFLLSLLANKSQNDANHRALLYNYYNHGLVRSQVAAINSRIN